LISLAFNGYSVPAFKRSHPFDQLKRISPLSREIPS
jgi:hypothetical protein